MNIRQRSVNVARSQLLEAIKKNREIHAAEYEVALVDFKTRLQEDLKAALEKVATKEPRDLSRFSVAVRFPQSHVQEYDDVIEMLEMSVDDTIELDSESFKAYIKNEWSWTNQFKAMTESYQVGGAFLSA